MDEYDEDDVRYEGDGEFRASKAAALSAGSVEYSAEQAAVKVDDLIETLQEMKDQGVEWVVQSSGNYRGAQWMSLGAGWEWLEG